jgi:hypothetical protein
MVHDVIAIQPQDAAKLQAVSQVLRLGLPILVGPHGEHATVPGGG